MAQITLDIPNDKAEELYQAFNSMVAKNEAVNPTNAQKLAFVKQQIVNYCRTTYHAYKARQAQEGTIYDETVAT